MTLLEKALNTIKDLRGSEVIENSDLSIDVVEVFERFDYFELTSIESYNPDTDEYEDIEFSDADEFISHMRDLYGIEEISSDNSYNWGSPVSNHFYYHVYYNEELNEYYYVVAIHKDGDVRGNYTNEFVLRFSSDFEFLQLLEDSTKYYTLKDAEGNDLYFDLRVVNEGLTYAEDDSYYYQDLNLLNYDSLEDLQKDILNL